MPCCHLSSAPNTHKITWTHLTCSRLRVRNCGPCRPPSSAPPPPRPPQKHQTRSQQRRGNHGAKCSQNQRQICLPGKLLALHIGPLNNKLTPVALVENGQRQMMRRNNAGSSVSFATAGPPSLRENERDSRQRPWPRETRSLRML